MANKIKNKKIKIIGRGPLDSYEDITRQEIKKLQKLTIEQAVKKTEDLLRNRLIWKK